MNKDELEDFLRRQGEFYERFPDCPRPLEIPCLDLVMKRKEALEILRGEKRFVWRVFSEFYEKKVCSMEFFAYAEVHKDDDVFNRLSRYAEYIRNVKKVCFHGCNGSWYLEVEVSAVHDFFADKDTAKKLREGYNCHDLDEEALYFARHPEKEPTEYLALEISEVLNTNLEGE